VKVRRLALEGVARAAFYINPRLSNEIFRWETASPRPDNRRMQTFTIRPKVTNEAAALWQQGYSWHGRNQGWRFGQARQCIQRSHALVALQLNHQN